MKQLNTILFALVLGLYLQPLLINAQPAGSQDKARMQDQSTKPDKKMDHDHASMQGMAALSSSDREFIMKAAAGGMMEVELAQLAVDKASSEEVKQFAQRLVDDHSKANQELMALASSKGVTLPAADMQKNQKMKDQFGKYAGAEFDREYIKAMVKDHQHDVMMFERQAKSGRATELKAFADKTLPTLREHLQMAQASAGKMGATNSAMKDKKGKMMVKP